MRTSIIVIILLYVVVCISGCAPIETLTSHDFSTDFYKLKKRDGSTSNVYADVINDSVVVYGVRNTSGVRLPVQDSTVSLRLSTITEADDLFGSRFSKYSVDADLSTVLTKLRPGQSGVPTQLNANLNALVYIGGRKDFFTIKAHKTLAGRSESFIWHIGFDAGFFAGFGITQVTPTNTNFKTFMEYDGIVFQKGIAAFITLDKITFGISLGFDNLLDKNSKIWIYNQKPWVGLVLGIANF